MRAPVCARRKRSSLLTSLFLCLASGDVASDAEGAQQRSVAVTVRPFRKSGPREWPSTTRPPRTSQRCPRSRMSRSVSAIMSAIADGMTSWSRRPISSSRGRPSRPCGSRVQRDQAAIKSFTNTSSVVPSITASSTRCLVRLISAPGALGARKDTRNGFQKRYVMLGEVPAPARVCAENTVDPILTLRPLVIPCAVASGET